MTVSKKRKFRVKFEDVERAFNEKNLQLLETEYSGVKYPMKFYCSRHDLIGYVKWTDFKQGKGGCRGCGKENNANKTPLEKVRRVVEEKGFKLITKEYINNKSLIIIECPAHGSLETTFDSFQRQKYGCVWCAAKVNSDAQRTPFEEIKKEYEDNGFILIDSKFIDWDTPMKCICLKHPDVVTSITRGNIRKGGCSQCRIDKISGENSYLWKGGITPENKKARQTSKYKAWRGKVFERDDYTCQCCNERGGTLHAHHIENFSDNINLRTKIENGITMCKCCHHLSIIGSFHHTYGAVNNDIYQLQEYFDDIRNHLSLPLVSIESIIHKEI